MPQHIRCQLDNVMMCPYLPGQVTYIDLQPATTTAYFSPCSSACNIIHSAFLQKRHLQVHC